MQGDVMAPCGPAFSVFSYLRGNQTFVQGTFTLNSPSQPSMEASALIHRPVRERSTTVKQDPGSA
jgi:hypothetical protein